MNVKKGTTMEAMTAASGWPGVCYQIFVRSFCDSNGDGIGDINGITSALGYLSGLGVEALWLTPVHPSPSYHKYDVTDYYAVDPELGTMDDFRLLLSEARAYGIRVYTDLVIHHTSILHPWFVASSASSSGPYRQYYRWMDPVLIRELGIDARETTHDAHTVNPWHRVTEGKERFLGIFSKEMADLNVDYAPVREEIRRMVKFWLLEVGVDGFRLDAARHIYPVWEDDRNPLFWEAFGKELDSISPGVYTVGEVWTDALNVAPYFKGLKANFNFELCFALHRMLEYGVDEGLVPMLLAQYAAFREVNPDFIDATMLSNHDQQRIGSRLKGHQGKLKLAASVLLTLPGQPYLYYGEEIGMKGSKPDPYLREPFQWGEGKFFRQACGERRFNKGMTTSWIKPRYNKPGESATLAEMMTDPGSLYYHYKSLIEVRKRHPAIRQLQHPNLEEVAFGDNSILAYIRTHNQSPVLVIHNLNHARKFLVLDEEIKSFRYFIFKTGNNTYLKDQELYLGAYESVILGKVLHDL